MINTNSCKANSTNSFELLVLGLFVLLAQHVVLAEDGDGCTAKWMEAALYFGTTIETFSRGFCLGFGVRMMKFTWIDGKEVSWKERAQVSAESGLAVACMVHGSAMFLPNHLRQYWFE